jgi:hypothetical protein
MIAHDASCAELPGTAGRSRGPATTPLQCPTTARTRTQCHLSDHLVHIGLCTGTSGRQCHVRTSWVPRPKVRSAYRGAACGRQECPGSRIGAVERRRTRGRIPGLPTLLGRGRGWGPLPGHSGGTASDSHRSSSATGPGIFTRPHPPGQTPIAPVSPAPVGSAPGRLAAKTEDGMLFRRCTKSDTSCNRMRFSSTSDRVLTTVRT